MLNPNAISPHTIPTATPLLTSETTTPQAADISTLSDAYSSEASSQDGSTPSPTTAIPEAPIIAKPAILATLPNGHDSAAYIKEMAEKSIIQTTNSDGSEIPLVSFYRDKKDQQQETNIFLKGELERKPPYAIDESDNLHADAPRNSYICGNGACTTHNYMMLTGHLHPSEIAVYSKDMRLTMVSILGASIDNKAMESLPQAINNGANAIISLPIKLQGGPYGHDHPLKKSQDKAPFRNIVARSKSKLVIRQQATICELEYQLHYLINKEQPEIMPFDVKISCQVNFRDGLWHLDPKSYRFSGKDAEMAKRICQKGSIGAEDGQLLVSRIRPQSDSLLATLVYPGLIPDLGAEIPELATIEHIIVETLEDAGTETIQKIGEILVMLETKRMALYKLTAEFDEKHLYSDSVATETPFDENLAEYKIKANKIMDETIAFLEDKKEHLSLPSNLIEQFKAYKEKFNTIVDAHKISSREAVTRPGASVGSEASTASSIMTTSMPATATASATKALYWTKARKKTEAAKVLVVLLGIGLCVGALVTAVVMTGGLTAIPLLGTAIGLTLSGTFSLQALGITIGAGLTALLTCTHVGTGLGLGLYKAAESFAGLFYKNATSKAVLAPTACPARSLPSSPLALPSPTSQP